MPSKKNVDLTSQIKDKFAESKSAIIVDYNGVTANEQVQLRQDVKKAGGEMFVTKNTLINIAVDKPSLKESLTGMNAVIFSNKDAVAAIKAVFEFHKKSKKLSIKQGVMEDRVLSFEEVESLSKLPSKDQLIAKLIVVIQGPSTGLVNAMGGVSRNLVQVLKAISEKSE